MATIVCGIDDSPAAFEALRVANVLSAGVDARLVLAHAAGGWTAATDESVTTNQARQGGNRLLERAAREHNPQAERRVEVGEPAEALARIAAEEAAILIIVGSPRRRLLRGRRRSGLPGDLVAIARCPIVVVPPPARR
jgi:nucleotide-binding universal stress UspA family protein